MGGEIRKKRRSLKNLLLEAGSECLITFVLAGIRRFMNFFSGKWFGIL